MSDQTNEHEAHVPAKKDENYWDWDCWRWGTHRVNCYPGSCPFRVYVKDGKVIREELAVSYPEFDDPDYTVPDYNPRGCQKGVQHSLAMYGPDRVLHPMKRAGERGSGKWEQISWEQAYDEIGRKVAETIRDHGAQTIIDDHATNGIGMVRGSSEITITGLTSLLGGVSFDLNFLIGDFNPGQYLTFGQFQHAPGIETWFLADTIIMMSNPVYANIPDIHYMLEARYRGSKIVAVAPDKSPSCQFADLWAPIDWSADPSMWLGVCRTLIDNDWIDREFLAEQTDSAVLVRSDDGRYLRESDIKEGGDDEQFFAIDKATGEIGRLDKGTLEMPFEYDLEGARSVQLADGSTVEVRTVFSLLKERLADYTPEYVHQTSAIHPEMVQQIAEWCRPPRKVFVFVNWNAGKLYHGDLVERGYCYMLALTGNIGKPGTGSRGWSAGTEFGTAMPMVAGMPREIIESDDPILESQNLLQKMAEDYKNQFKMDSTMPPVEAAFGSLRELLRNAGILSPPVFLWYYHAGYKDVWDRHLNDPHAPRKISEYAEQAIANGWWDKFDRPARDLDPKVMFVSGSNPLRRHRGGMNTYLKTLWPKLETIVVLDPRMSTTALYADYILPAASHYEYADAKYTSPHTRFNVFTDQSVPMLGESKTDRMIVLGLLRKSEEHLKRLGIEKYTSAEREILVDEMYWRATLGNRYGETNEDEERLLDDTYRALSAMGWLTSIDGGECSLSQMRVEGKAWLAGRPAWHASVAQNAAMVPGHVHYTFQDQVDLKVPYATTSRRIQFYIDHPWFIEADEHLVRYKEPPQIAGNHPARLTSGHVRWSVHANWHTSDEMLKLHRGEPFAFINTQEAEKKGIADNDFIRVYNDYGEFLTRAKMTSCVRPDQLVIYHAWEPYQHPNWMPHDGLLPGPPKGLQFAGGYRHFEYTLWNWAPLQHDRQTNVSFEKADYQQYPG